MPERRFWSVLARILRRRVGELLGELSPQDLGWLLRPRHHPPLLERRRARLVVSRVRIVSALFAVLTPLWILVDLFVFPEVLLLQLAGARLVASAAFAVVALAFRSAEHMRTAWIALGHMFLIPTLFFLYSQPLLANYEMDRMAAAVASGYAFLPFVMLVGLSVFPLTALENLMFASPVLLAEVGVAVWSLDLLDWTSHVGAFWLLLLIAVVASLAGMSQLHFMGALVRQLHHDPLTECLNRRSGSELLQYQFQLARRHGERLAVAFLDIDRFKPINDRFGHEAGDAILVQLARVLDLHRRSTDLLVRWGGEEFLLIFPHTGAAGAAEAVRRIMDKGLGRRPDDGLPLTVSAGIAELQRDGAASWETLVDCADQRMYRAKEQEGSSVVGPEESAEPLPVFAVRQG